MKKLLLLFISVLCLGLGAYAETVLFASGALPTGWSGDKVQKGSSRPAPVTTPLQILGGGYIQSPEYKNVSSIKVSLNITTKATTLTIAQSTDTGKTWSTIRTIANSECDSKGWKEFDVATTGDTSNGVMFKLSAAKNSYYISSFEYTTGGGSESGDKKSPNLAWIDYSQLIDGSTTTYGKPITAKTVKMSEANMSGELGYLYVQTALTSTETNDPIFEALTFSSSDEGVAKFTDSTDLYSLSGIAAGTTTITATFAGDATYKDSKATLTLTITPDNAVPATPVIKFDDVTTSEDGEYTVVPGTKVSVSSTGATYIIVTSTLDGEQILEGESTTITVNESDMYEFYGMNDEGESAHVIIDFTAKAPVGSGIVYSLVTSASDLVAGETYTIGCASKGTVMSTATQTNYRDYVSAELGKGSFEITPDMLTLTLEQDGNGWKIKTQNYTDTNGYFNAVDASEKNNNLLIDETGAKWAIEIGEDESHNATISTPDFTNTRYIYWNPSSPRFSAYLKPQTEVQLYRETVIAPTIEVDGEAITTVGSVDVKAGSLIRIIGHEANELHYIHNSSTTANRAPVANTEGWTKHDSNIYEYVVEPDFATKHITITAKGVKNGKESAPVSITLHNGSTTGIEGVESAENDAEVEWFTITGVRVQQPAEGGLYIRRQGSEVSKVRF